MSSCIDVSIQDADAFDEALKLYPTLQVLSKAQALK